MTFANRVRRIAIELKEAAKRDNRDSVEFRQFVETDKLKFFARGLDWKIIRRMSVMQTFQGAIEKAIEIEREVDCFEKRKILIKIRSIKKLAKARMGRPILKLCKTKRSKIVNFAKRKIT